MARAMTAVTAAPSLVRGPSAAWPTGVVLRNAWDRHGGEWISWAGCQATTATGDLPRRLCAACSLAGAAEPGHRLRGGPVHARAVASGVTGRRDRRITGDGRGGCLLPWGRRMGCCRCCCAAGGRRRLRRGVTQAIEAAVGSDPTGHYLLVEYLPRPGATDRTRLLIARAGHLHGDAGSAMPGHSSLAGRGSKCVRRGARAAR